MGDRIVQLIYEVIDESLADESSASILAKLRAASELRRKLDAVVCELLVEGRTAVDLIWGVRRPRHTYVELGAALGISPQGVRQRLQRTPCD